MDLAKWLGRSLLTLGGALVAAGSVAAQTFLEFPGHPATYGDHVVTTAWSGGPTSVVLTFESDESILHEDGLGQSQRTARNTLTYLPPSDPVNPQDYDDLSLVSIYGGRIPLLQQMSANGTSTLQFAFAAPVLSGFELWITDVDSSDDVFVRAYGPGDVPVDMTSWSLAAEGDLSLYKNTGAGFSSVVAPPPVVTWSASQLHLQATDALNYNRSYSIARAPVGSAVSRFEVEFTGTQNSASRAEGGTGSHIYVGLNTIDPATGVPNAPKDGAFRWISPNPGRGNLEFVVTLDTPGNASLELFDVGGRRVFESTWSQLNAGSHVLSANPEERQTLAPGVYFARVELPGVTGVHRLVRLR